MVSPSVSRKTNILGQDVSSTPSISIGDYTLEVVENFIYLGSTISINLSLDTELQKTDWQSSSRTGTSGKEGLGQHHVDHQHQDEGVPGLRAQHVTAARSRPSTPAKSADSTPSTCAASEGHWHHLARPCPKQGCPSTGGSTGGLAMPAAWRTGEFLRTYSTASLPLELELQEALRFISKMFVNEILKQEISTLQVGKLSLQTGHWRPSVKALRRVRRGERSIGMRERRRLRAASVPTEPRTEFICNNCNRACRSRIGLYSHKKVPGKIRDKYSRRCNSTTD